MMFYLTSVPSLCEDLIEDPDDKETEEMLIVKLTSSEKTFEEFKKAVIEVIDEAICEKDNIIKVKETDKGFLIEE